MKYLFISFLIFVSLSVKGNNKYSLIYQSSYTHISLLNVERRDTATIVYMQSMANPGDKFIFSKRTLYLDDEKHRKYRLTNIIGITIGDTIKYPLSGKIEFQLVFEPLGNDVVVFDLRTANESYSAFAFWGIHQGDRVLKKMKTPRRKNICLSKGDIHLKSGVAKVKGKISNYSATKEDTIEIKIRTISSKEYGGYELKGFPSLINRQGCFEFNVPVENITWSYIEGKKLKIPILLYPDDTLNVTVDHMYDINMGIEYHSSKRNDIMKNLMVADPKFVDWELAQKRYIRVSPIELRAEMIAKKEKTDSFIDYLTWKYKLSFIEEHLLRLQIMSFIDEVVINRIASNINSVIFDHSGIYDSNKVINQIENSPETMDACSFLKNINTSDYSYFVLPSQYLLMHLPHLQLFQYGKKEMRYHILEKHIGKSLDEEWRKRVEL